MLFKPAALVLVAFLGCAGSPGMVRAAEAEKPAPAYRIYPLRNGVCSVKGPCAFSGNEDDSKSYEFALYLWLVLGGEKPILIDAGLEDVAHMNQGAAQVFDAPITQRKDETSTAQLAKFGLKHEDIGHVLVTHLHFDHVDELFKYTSATYHVGKKEWKLCSADDGKSSWCDGRILFPLLRDEKLRKRLHLVEDEEILPGIESFRVGGHTPGSMAYRIRTAHGRVVCTGDTVSLFANMERPLGVAAKPDQVPAALKLIREKADIILPSHDPAVLDFWPPVPEGSRKYTIRPIRVGECQVTEEIIFQDAWGDSKNTRKFLLYVWLIEGGEKPILVDTGPSPLHIAEFNRATAKYIPGGVRQLPEEDSIAALVKAGVDPAAVSHVIVTHCHGDHYDYFPAFPSAKLVVNKTELENSRDGFPKEIQDFLKTRPDAIQAVGEEEVVPGIRTVHLGCHTEGSQGVLVQTHMGPALLCGDVAYLYENIEKNRPTRSPSPKDCLEAMAEIRALADIVLPSHDPLVLERWPSGKVGGKQN